LGESDAQVRQVFLEFCPTCSGKLRSRIKDTEPLRNFATKEWGGEEEAALVAGMDQLGEVVEEGSRKI